jgi:glycosyltransferase involved in cell wall biosynthesis
MLFPVGWEEPFGLVMVEAMACGTPVIAFPGGAVEEVVENGISGQICADVNEAVTALKTETFYPRVVRGWAEKNFSAEVMARSYYQIYSDLLEEPTVPADFDAEEAAA